MTNLLRRAINGRTRSITTVSDYLQAVNYMNFEGNSYAPALTQTYGSPQQVEQVRSDFASYAQNLYGSNSIVFS